MRAIQETELIQVQRMMQYNGLPASTPKFLQEEPLHGETIKFDQDSRETAVKMNGAMIYVLVVCINKKFCSSDIKDDTPRYSAKRGFENNVEARTSFHYLKI